MSYENRKIRYAKLEDAARLVEIYCYYVIEKTAITFEYEAPAVENFNKEWYMSWKYPYLVAMWIIKLSAMLMLVLLLLERLMIGV